MSVGHPRVINTLFIYYLVIHKILFIIISGVGLRPLGTAATSGLLYKPQMIDDGECVAIAEMKIGRGNRSTRRKPAPAPLCPPQIPHDQTQARPRAAAVGSQRLTAWAMARPIPKIIIMVGLWSAYMGYHYYYYYCLLCVFVLLMLTLLLAFGLFSKHINKQRTEI
jgi:hypothetical protein